jgi:hypothetical protein
VTAARAAAVLGLLCALAAPGCTEAPSSCLFDSDCGAGKYCENVMTLVSQTCVEGPLGKCQPLAQSMLGATCSTDEDCKQDSFVCQPSSGTCGTLACPQTAPPFTCPPGCVPGGRPWCAACTCQSCAGADASTGDG